METEKRARLEAAGWKVGSVQEFFNLSDEDMREIYAPFAEEAVALANEGLPDYADHLED